MRHLVYNDTLDRISDLEKGGKIFVIAPEKPLKISRAEKDMNLLNDGYRQGKDLALHRMPNLLDYLKK